MQPYWLLRLQGKPFLLQIFCTTFPENHNFVLLNTRDENDALFASVLCYIPVPVIRNFGWKQLKSDLSNYLFLGGGFVDLIHQTVLNYSLMYKTDPVL